MRDCLSTAKLVKFKLNQSYGPLNWSAFTSRIILVILVACGWPNFVEATLWKQRRRSGPNSAALEFNFRPQFGHELRFASITFALGPSERAPPPQCCGAPVSGPTLVQASGVRVARGRH